MFSLIIHTNSDRKPAVTVSKDRKISDVLAEQGVGTAGVSLNLNGALLPPGSMENTFADHGVQAGARIILSTIVKADSAA